MSAAPAPFHRSTETLDEAVTEQLKISDELRQIRELVAQKDADLIALRTQLTQVAGDSLRAMTAATVASANSELALKAATVASDKSALVLRGFGELRAQIAKLIGNGHG